LKANCFEGANDDKRALVKKIHNNLEVLYRTSKEINENY